MLRALLLLSLAWNAIIPSARVCRTEPGEPAPVCAPPGVKTCCGPTPECCAGPACDNSRPESSVAPRACSELLCLLCPCRVPTTPQESAPPGAKPVVQRVDTTTSPVFTFPLALIGVSALEIVESTRFHTHLSHNAHRALLSVWLK